MYSPAIIYLQYDISTTICWGSCHFCAQRSYRRKSPILFLDTSSTCPVTRQQLESRRGRLRRTFDGFVVDLMTEKQSFFMFLQVFLNIIFFEVFSPNCCLHFLSKKASFFFSFFFGKSLRWTSWRSSGGIALASKTLRAKITTGVWDGQATMMVLGCFGRFLWVFFFFFFFFFFFKFF